VETRIGELLATGMGKLKVARTLGIDRGSARDRRSSTGNRKKSQCPGTGKKSYR
jgi:hypothetical protein